MGDYKPRLLETKISEYFEVFSVVSVIGPRQCGKSTLLEHYSKQSQSKWQYFNLDIRALRSKVEADPDLFVKDFDSNIIIDEAQKVPDLFDALKSLVDKKFPHKILLSGSTNFLMLESISESMSGRVGILEMLPFSLSESLEISSNNIVYRLIQAKDTKSALKELKNLDHVEEKEIFDFILKGGFPKIHELKSNKAIDTWFQSYLTTYIDKDVRDIANISDLENFQNVYKLLAYQSSNMLNFSNIAGDIGLDTKTIKKFFTVLEMTYHYKKLFSFRENFKAKISKTPKLFSIDTGMLNHLLNNFEKDEMLNSGHWSKILETWVFSELYKQIKNSSPKRDLYFYRTRNDSEVDFVIQVGKQLIPIEVKSGYQVKPMQLRSMKTFIDDYSAKFKVPFGIVFHRADEVSNLADNIIGVPLTLLN
jgi:uncharacterized protein